MKSKNIQFVSTRDKNNKVHFWQSLIKGLSDDGGLLVPSRIPKIDASKIRDQKWWKSSTPADFAFFASRPFIPNDLVSDDELNKILSDALNFELPLDKISEKDFVLRIDRGPTASFKDIAARVLARLMEKYSINQENNINIVVATSGDTGVAIADAFGDMSRITVTVLYPHGAVSEIQEKQMINVHHKYENEQVIPIVGNFDNCQDLSKLIQMAR